MIFSVAVMAVAAGIFFLFPEKLVQIKKGLLKLSCPITL